MHASLKSSQEPRLKPLARGTLLLASVSLLVLTSACSNSDGDHEEANEEKPKGLSATKVCDASITGQAARDLRRLTGADTFEQTDEVKLKSVAEKLASSSDTVRSACEIYLPDASSPAVQIDFSRRTEHPTRSSFESSDADEWIIFPIGRHARASGSGADIYFSCPAKNKDVPDLIHGNLRSPRSSLSEKDTDFARISILNSVSRNLAKALGCSEESQLPEKVPASSERWTKN
ncbi:hypothetical protein [Streptomyces melanosporofaciens]|uniref:Lipoprotein n=1 Tax=Streptomyces melanosporofaciens TaxID=67327 RepID=A0A1H4ULZ7_STRMJ|nr:hypothetical protein [Streptomyces melanosporofaciens]SEC69819.1 hypothetical protein SAMN04490356_5162 [Streptomyces melanosporofaciens]